MVCQFGEHALAGSFRNSCISQGAGDEKCVAAVRAQEGDERLAAVVASAEEKVCVS